MSDVNETTDINTPFSYEHYKSTNSSYYLAANVSANNVFPLLYIFISSEEEVKGLSGHLNTIGKYYLYIRAAILGKVRIVYFFIFVDMALGTLCSSLISSFSFNNYYRK